jgi:predicted transcriptional regulator
MALDGKLLGRVAMCDLLHYNVLWRWYMPHTSTMTLRLTPDTVARLEGLARATDRSKAYLASRAIEEYLDTQEWQIKAIQLAVEEADKPDAKFLDHDEVVKIAKRFTSKNRERRAR